MSNSNQHIIDYLDWYFTTSKRDFGVLITGDWGSGKTFFVRKYLDNGFKNSTSLTDEKPPFVSYVSLFGVESRDEIDQRVLESFNPSFYTEETKFRIKGYKLAGKVLAFMAGGKKAADLIEEGVSFAKDVAEKISEKNSYVVVFDDVERADLPIPELLGYLNEFVEHQKIPTVLIAEHEVWQEAKIEQKSNATLHKLASVQEKVIGKALKVQTTIDEVIDVWFDPESGEKSFFSDSIRILLSNHRSILQDVLEIEKIAPTY